jgi:hypothetical protein
VPLREIMSQPGAEPMRRARQALDILVQTYIHHPDVSMIDMGFDRDPSGGDQIVLRVHVRQPSAAKALQLPTEIDGIPVRIMAGDYRPEG